MVAREPCRYGQQLKGSLGECRFLQKVAEHTPAHSV